MIAPSTEAPAQKSTFTTREDLKRQLVTLTLAARIERADQGRPALELSS